MVRVNTERVESAMVKNGLSIRSLAGRARMSYGACWRLVRGQTNGIRFETLDTLCRVLDLDPGDMIYRKDFASDAIKRLDLGNGNAGLSGYGVDGVDARD